MWSVMKAAVFILIWINATAYQIGDRVAASVQTIHTELKTPWTDFPLHVNPRFMKKDSVSFRAPLPLGDNGTAAINIRQNIRVLLSFSNRDGSLLSPYLSAYDPAERKKIKKLDVRFTHDAFEIIRVNYVVEYTSIFAGMTANALREFIIEYSWNSVEEENFPLGVKALFGSTLLAFLCLSYYIITHGGMLVQNAGTDRIWRDNHSSIDHNRGTYGSKRR